MKAATLLVLLGGVLGVIAFFVPMATVATHGTEVGVSAYQLFVGVDVLLDSVDAAQRETLHEIQGVVVVCFAPGALLAVIGLVAVVRRRFGRLGGAIAVLLGVVAALVFLGLNAGAEASEGEASRGPAMFLLLATAVLGFVGGLVAVVNPDRGPANPRDAHTFRATDPDHRQPRM